MKSVRTSGEITKKVSFGDTPTPNTGGKHNDLDNGVNFNSNNNTADRGSRSSIDSVSRKNSPLLFSMKKFSFHSKARSVEGGKLGMTVLPKRQYDQHNEDVDNITNLRSLSDQSKASDGSSNVVGKMIKKGRTFSLLHKPTTTAASYNEASRSVRSLVVDRAFDNHEYSDGVDRRSSRGSTNSSNIDADDYPMMSTRKSVLRRENIDASAMTMGMDELSANFLDFVSEAKCRDWLRSLSRRDPRYCIKAFFDDVATDGADNIEEENGFQPELLSPLLSMFQRSSIFSVWRPTSVDSIRKMMTGQGTGKGLDIKGKSAKMGKLSAYVPFLQIHDDMHKTKIRLLPRDGRIRVFYKKREARNHARLTLLEIMNDMVKRVADAERALNLVQEVPKGPKNRRHRPTSSESDRPSAAELQKLKKRLSNDETTSQHLQSVKDDEEKLRIGPGGRLSNSSGNLFRRASFTSFAVASDEDEIHWKVIDEWDMDDPSVQLIDDYSPKCFGIDMPKRLFWEGYVMRAKDISREPGSEYDTGRPSRASFQDMNFASIKDDFEEDTPRAVVWQYTDPYLPPNEPDPDPMMPQTLLMAYEEHGTVKPVVSDFDCFLLGTRGVRFRSNLPDEQVKMVHQMVDDIEKILKDCSEGRSTNWTAGWLNEMKRHITQVKMPKYGFGDPKSYAIMKYAVQRLEEFGAVRHGAECFNYYFPQELDDQYLVIGGNLDGAKYKYMTLPELQRFLSDCIDKGFTFPLNPKWVLCDEGWAALWDKLVGSTHPNVQMSINAWYPPGSGLRERIEGVRQKYPKGYQSDLSVRKKGTQAWDEAEMALERYQRIQRAKRKLYCVLCFISIVQQSQKKVKARQIEVVSTIAEEGSVNDKNMKKDEKIIFEEEEKKVLSLKGAKPRVSFSESTSSSTLSGDRVLEPPPIEPCAETSYFRSISQPSKASGRANAFRRSSSSGSNIANDVILEENSYVEVIESLLDGNFLLSETQKLGLHNIRQLLLSKEQQQPRPRMERRHTAVDARLSALMLEDVPYFIIREYGGDNALNDPVQKLQSQVKQIMNAQGFISAAGVRNSLVEGPYSGNGSFLPVEWTRLSLDKKKGLAEKLNFQSLSAWEYNIIDFSKECNGTPLLFIGWAVLGSPFAQKAIASDLGLDPSTQADGYDFVTDFNLKMPILCSFLRAVENDYLPNPYHNNTHAADVVQTLNATLQLGGKEFAQSSLQIFSILIAAVIHDVRHPGLNNNFQVNSRSELALQYNDVSVLENMSAAWFFSKILGPARDFTVDIFCGLTDVEFDKVRAIIIKSVLETDMTHHFALLKKLGFHQEMLKDKPVEAWRAPYIHEGTTYDPSMDMLCFLLHQADISNPAKPYPLFVEWADGILEECYAQGDKEISLSLPVSPLCDRVTTQKKQSQIGFIKFVVQPSIQLLGEIIPSFRKVVSPYIEKSLDYWEMLKDDEAC